MSKIADLNARRKLKELNQDPVLGPVLGPVIESQLRDVEAEMSGLDPRMERTAEKMIKRGFLSDLANMPLNDAMNSVFDDDGPEAA